MEMLINDYQYDSRTVYLDLHVLVWFGCCCFNAFPLLKLRYQFFRRHMGQFYCPHPLSFSKLRLAD